MKAYVKNLGLQNAPKPTKPVRVEQRGPIVGYEVLSPREIEEKRRIAREHSRASRADSWTDEEEETLRKMLKGGYGFQQIADCLPRRTLSAVETKYRRMRMKGEI